MLAFAATSFFAATFALQADPPPRDAGVHEVVTGDGLRIWSFPDDGGDRFLLMVLVGAGSRHEDPNTAGVAHFLEHVLLASTAIRSKEEANRTLDERGGNFNGYTTHEVTTYYLSCPSDSWEFAVEWLAEHVVQPGFASVDIDVEREIVYQEISNDMPHVGLVTLEEHLYPGHALGRSVGGDKREIRDLSGDDLRAFYGAHYRASNMAVGFAGKVPEEECLAAIQAAFAGLSGGGGVASVDEVSPRTGDEVLNRGSLGPAEGWVLTGFHLPSAGAGEAAILLHIGEYLSTRVFEEIREKRQLSYSPVASVELYSDTSRVDLSVEVSNRFELPTVMGVIGQLVAELESPDPSVLDSAKRSLAGTFQVNTAGHLGSAMELAWLMRRARSSPVALQSALATVTERDVGEYSKANLTADHSFALASAGLGRGPSKLWGAGIGLLALLLFVDCARGFPWLGALRSCLPRRRAKRRPSRSERVAAPIQPVPVDDLERSIHEYFEKEDESST